MEHYFTNNSNLKSDFRTITYEYAGDTISFTSDLGVFSKDKIDFGSRLLVENYLKTGLPNIDILDVGCGYGFIGLTLAKFKNTNSTLIDINKRAVHLAEMNIKNNKIVNARAFESYIYENVTGKYDAIITNPPIRAGREVVMGILKGAADHLNDDGTLWFVIRKNQGAETIMKLLSDTYSMEVVEKSKGFYIIIAKKLLTSI
jgi:16S rRNA (guanine1207-N2)-methyltransferase